MRTSGGTRRAALAAAVLGWLCFLADTRAQSTLDVDLDQFCETCIVDTGAGYYPHPLRCDIFIHCSRSGDNRTVMANIKECPEGLFWSQPDLTCRPETEVDCPNDPCKLPGRIAYREVWTCSAYYGCENGSRTGRTCCEDYFRFDEQSQRCVPDRTCRSACQPNTVLVSVSPHVTVCKLEEHPDDPTFYLVPVHGLRYRMPCSAGTIFSKETCSCIQGGKRAGKKCFPFIYLPFDDDTNDKSGNPKGIGSDHVKIVPVQDAVGGSAAYLNGSSSITVWALNNMEFASNFTLSFRFKGTDSGSGQFALVDNSDCNKSATFGVALEVSRSKGTLYGGFILKDESVVRIKVDLDPKRWHTVILLKSGSRAELWVDGKVHSTTGRADIKRLDCSMTIGKGTNLDPFTGYIDEVKFYKCTPDEHQVR